MTINVSAVNAFALAIVERGINLASSSASRVLLTCSSAASAAHECLSAAQVFSKAQWERIARGVAPPKAHAPKRKRTEERSLADPAVLAFLSNYIRAKKWSALRVGAQTRVWSRTLPLSLSAVEPTIYGISSEDEELEYVLQDMCDVVGRCTGMTMLVAEDQIVAWEKEAVA